MSDTVSPFSATPDIILRDPDPDTDALTSAIARHSDWLPQAEYEVRGLMLADQAIERQVEKAGEQIKILVDLYRAKIEALESHKQYFRRAIEAYIRMCNDGKKVSWPDVGVAYISKSPDRLHVINDDATMAICKELGADEMIRVKCELNKTKLKDMVQSTPGRFKGAAEIVPGEESLRLRRP